MIDIDIATQRLVWGVVAHLIADWLLQNDWMAKNKHQVGPAMAVHAMFHGLLMVPIFSGLEIAVLMFLHMFIDTRIPLRAWQKLISQTREGEVALHVSIWADQVAHVSSIAAVIILSGLI